MATIPLTSNAGFPTAGTVAIGTELITYSGKGTNTLTGATRQANGTTATSHNSGAVVTDASDYSGWGSAVEASTVTLESGLWSLSNFGQVLVATINPVSQCLYHHSLQAGATSHCLRFWVG